MSTPPSHRENQSDCKKKREKRKKNTCYLYAHTDLIMPVGEKKEKKRNKGRVLVNHRGSDKASKLK